MTAPARVRSEKRQRTEQCNFRLSPDEKARLESSAERAGVSFGSYVRDAALAADRWAEHRAELQRLATAPYLDEWEQADLYDQLAALVLRVLDGPGGTVTG